MRNQSAVINDNPLIQRSAASMASTQYVHLPRRCETSWNAIYWVLHFYPIGVLNAAVNEPGLGGLWFHTNPFIFCTFLVD